MDVGASTGGFTDVLLRRGAKGVIAMDVGYGQLVLKLREDPRVTVLDRMNIRLASPSDLPYEPELVTIDTSFISLRLVIPAVLALLAPRAEIVALIKPQFEVGKGKVGKGGVVKDEKLRREAVAGIVEFAEKIGLDGRRHARIADRRRGRKSRVSRVDEIPGRLPGDEAGVGGRPGYGWHQYPMRGRIRDRRGHPDGARRRRTRRARPATSPKISRLSFFICSIRARERGLGSPRAIGVAVPGPLDVHSRSRDGGAARRGMARISAQAQARNADRALDRARERRQRVGARRVLARRRARTSRRGAAHARHRSRRRNYRRWQIRSRTQRHGRRTRTRDRRARRSAMRLRRARMPRSVCVGVRPARPASRDRLGLRAGAQLPATVLDEEGNFSVRGAVRAGARAAIASRSRRSRSQATTSESQSRRSSTSSIPSWS